jgi:hypothetical protein
MKNGSFAGRLQSIMKDGNLTGADLARWFDRPDPTVRGWIRGYELRGPPLDAAYVEAQLDKLERLLKRKQGLPVPRMAPGKRIEHLNRLKDAR